MDLQSLINALGERAKEERTNYHTTLGELMSALGGAKNKTLPVVLSHDQELSVTAPHSYRGYYSDLSLEPTRSMMSVDDLLTALSSVHNTELTGWKGGEHMMDDDVPLWVSSEGDCSGCAIIDVILNDTNVTLVTKIVD